MDNREKIITWDQISKWSPLMVTAVSIAFAFASFDRRLALVEQKLDDLIVANQEMSRKYSSVEERYGVVATRVSVLETRLNIK